MKNHDVLVFFSHRNHRNGYIEKLHSILSTAAQKRELKIARGSLKDVHIDIKSNTMTITESLTGKNLDEYKLVYFELWAKAPQQALAVALYCQRKNIPFFSKELLYVGVTTKLGEMAKLADEAIAIPDTYFTSHRELKKVFKDSAPIAFPCIVKSNIGFGGKDNYLVKSYNELLEILELNPKVEFMVQEFIPNDCDYRCLVMGGQIVLVLKRSRDDKSQTHLNNTSQGGSGEVVPLDKLSAKAQAMVISAAKTLCREDFCGVDLMVNSQTGRPYILEVNESPQIEIGAAVDEKIDALLTYMTTRITKGAT